MLTRSLSGLAFAAGFSLFVLPANSVQASEWLVDTGSSSLTFAAGAGANAITGSLGQFDATISLDPEALADATITVVIPLADATTGRDDNDKALHSAEWFQTSDFPEAVYKSTAITRGAGGRYLAEGTLTLKGATVPTDLSFDLVINEDKANAVGTATVNRKAFNVGFPDGSLVPLDVTISFTLNATASK